MRSIVLRLHAALTHLLFSGVVVAAVAVLIFFVWYPFPYRQISGGLELFFLIAGVDIIVGPMITLVVFDIQKPRQALMRDLSIVALMQLAALGYGVHSMYIARPVHLVLEGNRFRVVRAIDVKSSGLPLAPEALRSLPVWGPDTIAARGPTTEAEQIKAIQSALNGEYYSQDPARWMPYDDARSSAMATARPLFHLMAKHPGRSAELEELARSLSRSVDSLGYLPILGRRTDWVAIVDRQTGDILTYSHFDAF